MDMQGRSYWRTTDVCLPAGNGSVVGSRLAAGFRAAVGGRPDQTAVLALKIAGIALLWRVLSAITAFLANVVFPLDSPQQFTVTGRTHYFWDAMARFDAGWYFGIAREGYTWVEGGRNSLAFFPVYPMLMGYLGYFMGGGQANYYYAGVIISWLAFAGAMVMLYRLARLDLDHAASLRACLYAAVFPFAFFYGAVYPSAVFIFLSITTFYAFRRGHWTVGALTGALVTATRVNGFLIWPALALLVVLQRRDDPVQLRRGLAALCAVPLGIAAYSTYAYLLSGSFFEWANSIQRWDYFPGRSPLGVFVTVLGYLADPYPALTRVPMAPYDLLNAAAAALGLAAVPFVWRRFGAPYAVYIVLNLALPLSTGDPVGLGRYTTVLFPIFIWLGTVQGQLRQSGILAFFAMFYMFCQALHVTLHPIY
jgi:hypothetical protein